MIRVKGTWSARVYRQSFEIEVESEEEIQDAIDEQMDPRNVVELTDFEFEVESQETIDNDWVEGDLAAEVD